MSILLLLSLFQKLRLLNLWRHFYYLMIFSFNHIKNVELFSENSFMGTSQDFISCRISLRQVKLFSIFQHRPIKRNTSVASGKPIYLVAHLSLLRLNHVIFYFIHIFHHLFQAYSSIIFIHIPVWLKKNEYSFKKRQKTSRCSTNMLNL